MNELVAHVQYFDYQGDCAADKRDIAAHTELLKQYGVELEGYSIYALTFWFGENHGRGLPKPSIDVYLTKDEELGHSLQEIKSNIESATDTVTLYKKSLNISIEDFLNLFKRLSFSLVRKGFPAEFDYEVTKLDEE